MKYYTATILIIISFLVGNIAFAQPPNIQKALDETKESLENLVTAKDENSPFDVAARIQTLKKVVDLAISEAKDLKINLLALDKIEDEALREWRGNTIEKINGVIDHYEKQKKFIADNESNLNLADVKNLASAFKEWREKNYIDISNTVQDLLLIQGERKILNIAQSRWKKISNDLDKLSALGISGVGELRKMLANAGQLIEEGVSLNRKAEELFFETNIAPEAKSKEEPVSTSTATSTATSTTPLPDESGEGVESTPPPEVAGQVRNLVGSSLENIRGAYQIFIEMSSLVRKLLN